MIGIILAGVLHARACTDAPKDPAPPGTAWTCGEDGKPALVPDIVYGDGVFHPWPEVLSWPHQDGCTTLNGTAFVCHLHGETVPISCPKSDEVRSPLDAQCRPKCSGGVCSVDDGMTWQDPNIKFQPPLHDDIGCRVDAKSGNLECKDKDGHNLPDGTMVQLQASPNSFPVPIESTTPLPLAYPPCGTPEAERTLLCIKWVIRPCQLLWNSSGVVDALPIGCKP